MKAENRISSLEQSLVHHILSFMDMKQVVQTSLLSKRWRNVWHSLRILNFDEESWRSSRNDNKLNKGKFKFFVDTVLLLRDGSDIDTFNLFFSSAHFGDFDRIDRWVAYGMERSVQVVTLVGLHVPSPSSICLSANVSCLDLGAIIFPRDGNMELVLDLSVVENLNIQNCDHIKINKLIISGLKLKYLRLANDFQEFNCDTSVKLCAPNLVSLKCNGYAYEEYALEDLTSLVTAEIDTMIVCKDELKGAPEAQEVVNIWWYGRCLEQILKGITTAKSLTLSGHGFQVFKELPEMLEGEPISFPRLKYLKITEWCDKSYIHQLAKSLEIFPHLETLVLERTKTTFESELDGGDWDAALSFTCMFHQLKSIEMQHFEGSENEFKFLEFFLRSALVLDIVNITSTIKSSDKEELDKVNKNVQSLQKAFPGVTILLSLKRVF